MIKKEFFGYFSVGRERVIEDVLVTVIDHGNILINTPMVVRILRQDLTEPPFRD